MISNSGQAAETTEIAGEATVDSPPSERDSDSGENGLDAGGDDGVTLPGPTYNIETTSGATQESE